MIRRACSIWFAPFAGPPDLYPRTGLSVVAANSGRSAVSFWGAGGDRPPASSSPSRRRLATQPDGSALCRPGCGTAEQAEQSLRRSPRGSLLFMPYVGLAYAHFFAGRFDEAALSASRCAQANPPFSIPWVLRTASLAKLGRGEETKASAERLRELWPSFTIREYLGSNFTSPEHLAMFDEALRLAGLPDG